MPDARSELEARLRTLAQSRARATAHQKALAADIRRTVAEAQQAGISMSQVARLLELDRSTLYRTYLNGAAP